MAICLLVSQCCGPHILSSSSTADHCPGLVRLDQRLVQRPTAGLGMNNRRLYALKQYQEQVQHTVKVKLRVRNCADPTIRRFLRAFTTQCMGNRIGVRPAARGVGRFGKRVAARQRQRHGGKGGAVMSIITNTSLTLHQSLATSLPKRS